MGVYIVKEVLEAKFTGASFKESEESVRKVLISDLSDWVEKGQKSCG